MTNAKPQSRFQRSDSQQQDPLKDQPRRCRFTREAPIRLKLVTQASPPPVKPPEAKKSVSKFSRANLVKKSFPVPMDSLPNIMALPPLGNVYSRGRTLGFYDPKKPQTTTYGNRKVELSGAELNVQDEIWIIVLSRLVRKYQSEEILISRHELYDILGKKYSTRLKESFSKVFWRLRHAKFNNIVTDNLGQRSVDIGIIGSFGEEKRKGKRDKIRIVVDHDFYTLIQCGFMTSIDLPFLLSLKGDLTKQIYFTSGFHVSARKKQSEYELYSYGLENYCDLINFDRDHERPASTKWLRQKRKQFKAAFEQLSDKGYLSYSPEDLHKNLISLTIKFREIPKSGEYERVGFRKRFDQIALPWKREPSKKQEIENPQPERASDEPTRHRRSFNRDNVAVKSPREDNASVKYITAAQEEIIIDVDYEPLDIESTYQKALEQLDFDEEKCWRKST